MPTLLKAFTPEASQGTFSFLGLRCLNVSAIPGQWPANYSAILLLVWCYPHVTLTTRPLGVRLLSVRRAFWRWANSETIDKPNPLPVVPWPESPKALSDVIQNVPRGVRRTSKRTSATYTFGRLAPISTRRLSRSSHTAQNRLIFTCSAFKLDARR